METGISMLLGSVRDSVEIAVTFLAAVTALAGAVKGVLTAIAALRRRSDGSDDDPETSSVRRRPIGPTDRSKAGAEVVVQRWDGPSIPPSPKIVAAPKRHDRDRWYHGRAEEDDPNLWAGNAKKPDPPTIQSKPRSKSSRWWTRTDESALVGPGGSRHGTN
jgi:hypothetical protein